MNSIPILTHFTKFCPIYTCTLPKISQSPDQTPFPTGLPSPSIVHPSTPSSILRNGYQTEFYWRNGSCLRSPSPFPTYRYQDALQKIEAYSCSYVWNDLWILSSLLCCHQLCNSFVMSVRLWTYAPCCCQNYGSEGPTFNIQNSFFVFIFLDILMMNIGFSNFHVDKWLTIRVKDFNVQKRTLVRTPNSNTRHV